MDSCGVIREIYAKAKQSIVVERDAPVSDAANDFSTILDNIGCPTVSSIITQYEKKLDIVFAFDTTGSMFEIIKVVREFFVQFVESFLRMRGGVRVGLCAIGDYCDSFTEYAVDCLDFNQDPRDIRYWFYDLHGTLGGDFPEAYELFLEQIQGMNWREDSEQVVILVGDSVPHPNTYTDKNIYWFDELQDLVESHPTLKLHVIHPLFAAKSPDEIVQAQDFLREIAQRTGGSYVELTRIYHIFDYMLAVFVKAVGGAEKFKALKDAVAAIPSMEPWKTKLLEDLDNCKKIDKDTPLDVTKTYPWWFKTEQKGKPLFQFNDKIEIWIPTYSSFTRAFFPTEKDIAEDKLALKMLSVQKRNQKKNPPSRPRSHENSIDYSESDSEECEKPATKKDVSIDKPRKGKSKGSKTDDRGAKKTLLKQVKKEHDDDDKEGEEEEEEEEEEDTKKTRKYNLRTSSVKQPSAKRVKVEDDETDEEEDSNFYDNIYGGQEVTITRSKASGRHKVIVVHEESDDSDSDIDQSEITVGRDYAVRGTEKEIWVGRVTGAEEKGFWVQWFEELRAYPGYYALLTWYAFVPPSSIIKELKMECNKCTGMWKLETELPAFKIYKK